MASTFNSDSSFLSNIPLIVLPGWAGCRDLESWMGRSACCISHLEQVPMLLGESAVAELRWPEGIWDLVSWSMGNWTALLLAACWKNPPRSWIMLNPFHSLLQPQGLVAQEDFDKLASSFSEDPWRTCKHFCKSHGAKQAWAEQKQIEAHAPMLLQSLLHLRAGPPPIPKTTKIPLLCISSGKDSLCDESSVKAFYTLQPDLVHTHLSNSTHALLYEEPKVLEAPVQSFWHHHAQP